MISQDIIAGLYPERYHDVMVFCQVRSWSVIVFRNGGSLALSNLHENVLSDLLSSIPAQQNTIPYLGPLHVGRAGSLTRTNFTLGSYEKFQPGFRDDKRPKTSCGAKFEKQSKHGETQNYNFHAY